MDKKKIEQLEHKFDKGLTEGEAAEIANTDVIHRDDEEIYEEPVTANNIQISGIGNRMFQ